MSKKQEDLNKTEAEVIRHIGCRIKFYYDGKNHLGRIESGHVDKEWEDVAIWVTPEDPAVCNPWPRLKLTPSNVVEIVDNPHGYQEDPIPGH